MKLLIAFEGIDGAGKYIQLQKTKTWLEKEVVECFVPHSSEPADDTPLGKAIRAMLKGTLAKPKDPFEFQRLYVLHRAELIATRARPFFEDCAKENIPAVLLKKRYAMSTVAYGMLSGRPPEDFIRLHEEIMGPQMIWPDLTILLDCPAKEAVRRIAARNGKPEYFEKVPTLEKVRENYLAACDVDPFKGKGRVMVVDGTPPENGVFENVQNAVARMILAQVFS